VTRQIVRFRAGEGRFAVPVEHAQHVVSAMGITELPSGRPDVAGLLEVDGRALTVFTTLGAGRRHVLVLGEDRPRLGLLVAEVEGVDRVDDAEVGSPPGGQRAPFVSGVIPYPEGMVLLIDAVTLAETLRAEAT
jgi:chemotaxis signal transduction protein